MTTHTAADASALAYRTVNPATDEVVREWATATDAEAEALLARAHAAYLSWRQTSVAERVRLFRRFADLVDDHADELARLVTLEMGKPVAEARGEARMAGEMFRYFAEHGPALLADEEVEVVGFSHMVVRREPIGVVLAIEPWNGPLYQAMRPTAPNLMLGNTVLVKPSELSAGSTLLLASLFAQAGFPADVFQTALITHEHASSYIADPRVRAVTLTGSDHAGSAIGEQAGRHIKPVVLELGGSDAFLVLDSADIDKAAATAATCRLYGGGQVCASPKRVIVTEAVAEKFTAAFNAAFADQKVGDPFDPETAIGPLSSRRAVDILQGQYEDAVDKGATVLVSGGRIDGPGAFFRPAALSGITPEMRLYTEEAFGPLAMIYTVPNADAAVELANSSPYGLGGTVFAENLDEARRVAGLLDTGMVGINRWLGAPAEIPFGGTKRSGVGREMGRTGLDAFANLKTYGIA
ncbi:MULTISPECIES: aldehyde dehydrogenase family protein [unclassified Streptomyces]|uniref:aldehyde dehydrogenase family protein n=1 Tax=unclassified Streptomyces TaxID=2593676 RepID=UPI003D8B301C